jgi:GTP-binding protein
LSHYYQASFIKSSPRLRDAPEDKGREIAFMGRSNAGKSSVINVITNQNSLARTSKTPGRTQQMNFFALGQEQRLVDFPGLGFARVSEQQRQAWQHTLIDYLTNRQSLQGIMLITDIRHAPTKWDEELLSLSEYHQIPVHILLNKSDKLKRGPAQNILKSLQGLFAGPVSLQTFSATKRVGVDLAHQHMDRWIHPDED